MKLYDFFMLLENLEAFRTAKGVPLACQKFIRIDHMGLYKDLSQELRMHSRSLSVSLSRVVKHLV